VTDDQRKQLEAAARAADQIAAEHRPTCGTAVLMRAVSEGARNTLAAHKGPAQVATLAYRKNWETLFGKRQTVGQA
jgi:hypothetical protein